jgi:cytidylate kinase
MRELRLINAPSSRNILSRTISAEVHMSRSIEQLVDQQVLKWMAERQIADRASWRPGPIENGVGEQHRPIICISRECGALGAHVGRIVAERLGFTFYAQELIDEIAKQAHVRRKVVESLDERRRKRVSRWIDELVRIGRFTPSDYMRNLSEVVLTIGRHGGSVIIGRGAFFLLDARHTLRVRCHAPLEWRIAQLARRRGLGEAEAREMVLRIDSERVDFYRENFNVDVREPWHFDLLLNMAASSESECVNRILETYDARFAPPKSEARLRGSPADAPVASPATGTST